MSLLIEVAEISALLNHSNVLKVHLKKEVLIIWRRDTEKAIAVLVNSDIAD